MLPEHTEVTAHHSACSPSQAYQEHVVEVLQQGLGREGAQEQACQGVRGILARVGDKWSVLIVMLLGDGSRRFNEIKRLVEGISQRMLTMTLRGLERDGLVKRTVTPSNPPRVDYELTDLGLSLRCPIHALGSWAFENKSRIEEARREFDSRAETD